MRYYWVYQNVNQFCYQFPQAVGASVCVEAFFFILRCSASVHCNHSPYSTLNRIRKNLHVQTGLSVLSGCSLVTVDLSVDGALLKHTCTCTQGLVVNHWSNYRYIDWAMRHAFVLSFTQSWCINMVVSVHRHNHEISGLLFSGPGRNHEVLSKTLDWSYRELHTTSTLL